MLKYIMRLSSDNVTTVIVTTKNFIKGAPEIIID